MIKLISILIFLGLCQFAMAQQRDTVHPIDGKSEESGIGTTLVDEHKSKETVPVHKNSKKLKEKSKTEKTSDY